MRIDFVLNSIVRYRTQKEKWKIKNIAKRRKATHFVRSFRWASEWSDSLFVCDYLFTLNKVISKCNQRTYLCLSIFETLYSYFDVPTPRPPPQCIPFPYTVCIWWHMKWFNSLILESGINNDRPLSSLPMRLYFHTRGIHHRLLLHSQLRRMCGLPSPQWRQTYLFASHTHWPYPETA